MLAAQSPGCTVCMRGMGGRSVAPSLAGGSRGWPAAPGCARTPLMPHGEVSAIIPAPCADVFDLVHDYDRRLTWDTLLQEAYLDDGFTRAEKGATSVCR